MAGEQVAAARRASRPHLGQDNEYVYKEVMGYSDAEYRGFEERGHIGTEYDADIP